MKPITYLYISVLVIVCFLIYYLYSIMSNNGYGYFTPPPLKSKKFYTIFPWSLSWSWVRNRLMVGNRVLASIVIFHQLKHSGQNCHQKNR